MLSGKIDGGRDARRMAGALLALSLLIGGCGTTGETDGATDPVGADAGASGDTTDETADEPTGNTEPAVTSPDDTEPDVIEPDEPDAGDDPATEPPEACDLLTADDVEAAFDEAVEPGENDYSDECWWATADGQKSVNLQIEQTDLDEWRSALDNDSWEPIDLGDEGYVGVSMFDTVEFAVGDTVYEINVNYSTAGDPDEVVRELAELVESRL